MPLLSNRCGLKTGWVALRLCHHFLLQSVIHYERPESDVSNPYSYAYDFCCQWSCYILNKFLLVCCQSGLLQASIIVVYLLPLTSEIEVQKKHFRSASKCCFNLLNHNVTGIILNPKTLQCGGLAAGERQYK